MIHAQSLKNHRAKLEQLFFSATHGTLKAREKTNSTRGQLPTHGNPVEALPSPFQKPWENSEEQRKRNWKVFTALPETPMLAPKPHPAVPNNQHPFSTRPRDTFWDTSDTADESSAKRLTAQSAIRMIDKYNISTKTSITHYLNHISHIVSLSGVMLPNSEQLACGLHRSTALEFYLVTKRPTLINL